MKTVADSMMRRFSEHKPVGNPKMLALGHRAVTEARTVYPHTIRTPGAYDWVLKSGHNSRKIGAKVTKGAWAGMPIYTLTLEERATCPRTCGEWQSCMGNKMNWALRYEHGPALEDAIYAHLKVLEREHPHGFVVRLHVLGDFYSIEYVRLWLRWLDEFTGLRVFGYTAWPIDTEIGAALADAARTQWHRFAVRQSGSPEPVRTSVTIAHEALAPAGAVVCPAQTGKTDCCGTCALCWSTTKPIAFVRH